MKFTLTRRHLYWWPVTIAVPHPDHARAGDMVEMTFRMRFEALPRDEAKAMRERLAAAPTAAPAAAPTAAPAAAPTAAPAAAAEPHEDLMRVVRDWDEDVVDDAGRPVPFSAETLSELLQISWYRLGVYRAWAASLVGEAPRRGN